MLILSSIADMTFLYSEALTATLRCIRIPQLCRGVLVKNSLPNIESSYYLYGWYRSFSRLRDTASQKSTMEKSLKIERSVSKSSSSATTGWCADTTSEQPERPWVNSLYVPRILRSVVYAALTPHMNFDAWFHCLRSTSLELQLRGSLYAYYTNERLEYLKEKWEQYKLLQNVIWQNSAEERKLSAKILELSKRNRDAQGLIEDLNNQLLHLKSELTNIYRMQYEQEFYLLPQLLELPCKLNFSLLNADFFGQTSGSSNSSDSITDVSSDVVIYSHVTCPSFSNFVPKSHVELSEKRKEIDLHPIVGPGCFYFIGKLAQVEIILEDLALEKLQKCGYLTQCNPDFAKGVVVGGCGYMEKYIFAQQIECFFREHEKMFSELLPGITLKEESNIYNHDIEMLPLRLFTGDKHAYSQYLVGGASLPAFLGYFANKIVTKTKKFLPQKLCTAGRLYRQPIHMKSSEIATSNVKDSNFPSTDDIKKFGILASLQSNSVSALVASPTRSSTELDTVKELLQVIVSLYRELDIHFRIVRAKVSSLRPYEKLALSVQLYLPSMAKSEAESYIEVGRISVVGDYISQRLLMLHQLENPKPKPVTSAFLNIVFAEVLNTSSTIAALMENLQTESGDYRLPDVLLQRLQAA